MKNPLYLRVPASFRLPQWLLNWLRKRSNQSQTITDSLCLAYGLSAPDEKADSVTLFDPEDDTLFSDTTRAVLNEDWRAYVEVEGIPLGTDEYAATRKAYKYWVMRTHKH